jgi:pimeloyl-ACP methyl ester carboxylesterase
MTPSSTGRPAPEGPGSVSGAPHLPEGFTGTFTSRYVDTGELRLHVVTGGDHLRGSFGFYRALPATIAQNERRKTRRLTLPVLAIGGGESSGEGVGNTMELAADDVQALVIPGCGHWVAEQAPEELLAALTAFLAPYRDRAAAGANP